MGSLTGRTNTPNTYGCFYQDYLLLHASTEQAQSFLVHTNKLQGSL